MSYVSLHKSKSGRAIKGGKIIGFRNATEEEIAEHQDLLNKVDPIVKTKSLKNKVVFSKDSAFVLNHFQPVCWSPVGDASPSSPPSGSAVSSYCVKAARNEHPQGLALTQ